jgi:TolA-binding protein
MTEIIVAIIAGGLSLIGVIITNNSNSKRMTSQIEQQLQISQAVTDTKIEELTREVRAHNNFAIRVPVLEEQIKVANHRIDDLEDFHKPHT